jgi:hypothetical protein
MIELVRKLGDSATDLVSYGSHDLDRLTGWILELPVDVVLARNVGAFVAAAHGHDDVGPLHVLPVEGVRLLPGEVDVELAHRFDDCPVDARGGPATCRASAVSVGRDALEERLRHLASARVLDADEEDAAHPGGRVAGARIASGISSSPPAPQAG